MEALFFGAVLANMLMFGWLCASNPGKRFWPDIDSFFMPIALARDSKFAMMLVSSFNQLVTAHSNFRDALLSSSGYITTDGASMLMQPARALALSEACAATSSSDLETMGLLPRTGGFSDQLLVDDCTRAALLAERKLTPSPCPISETDDTWNVGSEHCIELLDNPSRMGSRQAHYRSDMCVAHEWFEGSVPGRVCCACGSWQSLRSRHCHDCRRCIEKFDHHCHWIGKCIGHGNQHLFWMFLLTETVVIMWVLAIILQEISSTNPAERFLHRPVWKICVWGFVLLPLLLGLLASGGLLLFHTYLLCTNQTTFEYAARWKVDYLKDIPSTRNPFDKGCINNLADACCFKLGHQYTLPSREVNLSASTSVSAIQPSGN